MEAEAKGAKTDLPIQLREPGWVAEFMAFLLHGVDLARSLAVGAAFITIVSSRTEDLLNLIIGLLVGNADFSNQVTVLNSERKACLAATREGGAAVLAAGSSANAGIKFDDISFAVEW